MNTVIGYISKSELNWYINTPIGKDNGTPIILEVWKDGEDYQSCCKGAHLKKVEITIKEINQIDYGSKKTKI